MTPEPTNQPTAESELDKAIEEMKLTTVDVLHQVNCKCCRCIVMKAAKLSSELKWENEALKAGAFDRIVVSIQERDGLLSIIKQLSEALDDTVKIIDRNFGKSLRGGSNRSYQQWKEALAIAQPYIQ